MHELIKLPPNHSGLKRETKLLQARKAFKMRTEEGLTYEQIGDRLGVSLETARKRCNYVSELEAKNLMRSKEKSTSEMEGQLDTLLARWFPLANSNELVVGKDKENKKTGEVYFIQLDSWEASKTALDACMQIFDKKIKLNFHKRSTVAAAGRREDGGELTPEQTGRVAASMFEAMRDAANKTTPRPIEAIIIDGQTGET